jgi:hypothetical protein
VTKSRNFSDGPAGARVPGERSSMNLLPLDISGLRSCSLPPIYRLRPRHWKTLVAYYLRASALSATRRLSLNAASQPGGSADDTLFIIGYWRSGTTLLHELLSLNSRRVTPTTHQCFNPQSFAMQRPGGAKARRPMDAVVISANSPQEDEFALAGLGAQSPYQLWLTPSRMATCWTHGLKFRNLGEEDRWFATFSEFAGRIAGPGSVPLLLKSPPHAFRVALLAKRLPRSKFIYIARDPLEVYHSAVNMFVKMLEIYALEPWKRDEVERYVIDTRLLLSETIHDSAMKLGPERLAHVRFEALLANPVEEIVKALHRLDEPCTDSFIDRLEASAQDMKAYQRGYESRRLDLPDKVAAEWAKVIRTWNAGELI